MKKLVLNFARILAALICFTGIMGLYFSYCFNTKDTELAFLSIKINMFGAVLYFSCTNWLRKIQRKIKRLFLEVLQFMIILPLGLLLFYLHRYPNDILLTVFGLVTTISQLILLGGIPRKNKLG